MHTLIWFARVGEAAVLAAAGFLKARHPTTARAAVGALGVPARLAAPIAIALPMVELVVAGLLLVGPLLWAARGTLALMISFDLVVGFRASRGDLGLCHCFGAWSGTIGWRTLPRNAALTGVAVFLLAAAR